MSKADAFAGSLAECLKHFGQTQHLDQSDRETYLRRNRICDLLGIAKTTGFRWFGRYEIPVGENLLRLQFFLELVGYQVAERQRLSSPVRELSDQIALSLISINEVVQQLEIMSDTVLRWVLGKSEPVKEKIPLINGLVVVKRPLVTEKMLEWQSKLAVLGLVPTNIVEVNQEKVAVPRPAITSIRPSDQHKEAMLKSLAAQIRAIKPLAEMVLSDAFSAEDRIRLRQLATSNGSGHIHDVFEVSNLLNRLCGERARREL